MKRPGPIRLPATLEGHQLAAVLRSMGHQVLVQTVRPLVRPMDDDELEAEPGQVVDLDQPLVKR